MSEAEHIPNEIVGEPDIASILTGFDFKKKYSLAELAGIFHFDEAEGQSGLATLSGKLRESGAVMMGMPDGKYLIVDERAKLQNKAAEAEPPNNVAEKASLMQIFNFVMDLKKQFRNEWFEAAAVEHENKVRVGITGIRDRDDFLDFLTEYRLLNKKIADVFGKGLPKYQVDPSFRWQESNKVQEMILQSIEMLKNMSKGDMLKMLAARTPEEK